MVSLIYIVFLVRFLNFVQSLNFLDDFSRFLSNIFAEVIPQKIPAAVALAHMLKKPEEPQQQQQQPQKQQQQVEGH